MGGTDAILEGILSKVFRLNNDKLEARFEKLTVGCAP
jgi:hypothetical protein